MEIFGMGPLEIILILVIALIIFGPGKLPQIGRDLGKAFRSFKKATSDLSSEMTKELKELEEEKTKIGAEVKQTIDKTVEASEPKAS